MWIQSANRGNISGTPDQLTRLARCSGSELESFLSAAQQHGLCEVSRDSNGIVTLKHPGLLREDRVRKQTALRVARHRQKTAKSSVTVPVTEIGPRHQSSEQIEETGGPLFRELDPVNHGGIDSLVIANQFPASIILIPCSTV